MKVVDKDIKKLKGISKATVKQQIKFENAYDSLYNGENNII